MLEGFVLVFVVLWVAATLQGDFCALDSEHPSWDEKFATADMYRFYIDYGWTNYWPYVWAGCGAALVSLFWLVTMWQAGWSYVQFLSYYEPALPGSTLWIPVWIPVALYSANWLAQYRKAQAPMKLIELVGVALIGVTLGPIAYPVIAFVWLPYLGIAKVYEWAEDRFTDWAIGG